ncbi:MAG: type II toxin-antitoxin system VapC family toxin [Candidatus Competibacteraceae bacterium]
MAALFVLDTDHLSLFQRGHDSLLPRIRAIPASRIAITIITVEEMLQGRLAQVRRASQGEDRINAYTWLEKTVLFFQAFQILSFDAEAERRYANLVARRLGIGAQDLKIAAIALSHNAVLVTRNRRDFNRVPELSLDDWTIK